jgi:HEAT repeat protein
MKDLRIVLLIGVPVLAAAAALFVYADPFGSSDSVPAGIADPFEKELHDGPVDHEKWPKEPVQRGNSVHVRPPPKSGLPDVLTLEYLKELLAKGDFSSWATIEQMLKYGVVEDQMGVQALLVGALGKVQNASHWIIKLLPLLDDEAALKQATQDLLALTRHSMDVHVLKGALGALGQIGGGEAAAAVSGWISALSPDDEKYQEKAATGLFALAAIGTVESAAELARLLENQQGTKLADLVVKAIGRVEEGLPQLVEALSPYLADEASPELRMSAVRALGLTGADEAVESLRAVYGSETADRKLREEAILALGRVGNAEAVDELLRIMEEDEENAWAAGMALRFVDRREAVEPMLEALDGVEDSRVQSGMIQAFGNIEDPRAHEKLNEYLGDAERDSGVRSQSAQSMGKIGDPKSADAFAEILGTWKEQDARVVEGVLIGAGNLASHAAAAAGLVEKVIPAVREIVEKADKSSRLWHRAMRTLDRLERMSAEPVNPRAVPIELPRPRRGK